MELPYLYLKGSHVTFLYYDAVPSIRVHDDLFLFLNSADPDETPHYAAFHLVLHCLPNNAAFHLGLHCLPNNAAFHP